MAHLPHRAIKSRNLAERCWSDLAESGTLCRDNVGGLEEIPRCVRTFPWIRASAPSSPEAVTPRGEPVVRQRRVEPSLRENGTSGLYESIDRYHRPIGARHTSEYRSVCPRPVASDL